MNSPSTASPDAVADDQVLFGRIRNVSFLRTGKPTRTERRVLAEEAHRKTPFLSLAQALYIRALKNAATSGSKPCLCGQKISANKLTCLACSRVADGHENPYLPEDYRQNLLKALAQTA